jgi:hypothetical protein
MSLLYSYRGFEPCTVYPEVTRTDTDGNTITEASTTGTATVARFQIQGQSGTSSRRAEQQDEGFDTERVYTVRFPRGQFENLGSQSEVEWDGLRWGIFGDRQRYNSSPRTSHVIYTLRRN